MSHHRQALRQISIDKNQEITVRMKYTEDEHEDRYFYSHECVSKKKYKKYCRRIYSLYSGRLIYIDMLLYNFILVLITNTLQHLMEIVRNPVNLV